MATGVSWSPKAFLSAYLDGQDLADCVRASGAPKWADNDDATLKRIGYGRMRSPNLQKLIGDYRAELEGSFYAHMRWIDDLVRSRVEGTNRDKLDAGQTLGRVLGKFIEKVDVTHTLVIPYKRLVRSEDIDHEKVIESTSMGARPALPESVEKSLEAVSDEALLAELSRRASKKNVAALAEPAKQA